MSDVLRNNVVEPFVVQKFIDSCDIRMACILQNLQLPKHQLLQRHVIVNLILLNNLYCAFQFCLLVLCDTDLAKAAFTKDTYYFKTTNF